MIRTVLLFILWYAVWIALSWPLAGHEVFTGIAAALFVTFMTIDLDGKAGAREKRNPFSYFARLVWFLCYVVVFLWECLRANVDVAFRVLHPTLPIRPGTVRVKTGLKTDLALTFLANSITLTPGTTTVDVDKENGFIYVHWLYIREKHGKIAVRLDTVTRFEKIIKRIFE